MLKFIRLYILRLRLARIISAAEKAVEQGKEPGDEVFINLMNDVHRILGPFEYLYPEFDGNKEIPAILDLQKLTIATPPVSPEHKVGLVLAGMGVLIGSAVVLAGYAAMVHDFYRLFVR